MSASRSWRSPPRARRSPRKRSKRSRSTSSSCRMSPIRWKACSPAAPMRARTAMSRPAQINLQTVKWDAGDFAAAGDDKMPLGKPAEEWAYGDIDAGFKAAKLIIEESFVSGGLLAPQHGDALRLRLLAGRQVHPPWLEPEPHRGRRQHRPPDRHQAGRPRPHRRVLRRRLRQQDSRLSQHGDRRADVEEDQPAGDAPHLPHGGIRHRQRPPGFQGHVKMGFREDGKLLAADLYIVQESGPHIGGGDFRAAGNALSMVYQPDAMRWRARAGAHQHAAGRPAARPRREPVRRRSSSR